MAATQTIDLPRVQGKVAQVLNRVKKGQRVRILINGISFNAKVETKILDKANKRESQSTQFEIEKGPVLKLVKAKPVKRRSSVKVTALTTAYVREEYGLTSDEWETASNKLDEEAEAAVKKGTAKEFTGDLRALLHGKVKSKN